LKNAKKEMPNELMTRRMGDVMSFPAYITKDGRGRKTLKKERTEKYKRSD
jgi:hypothetical protein